MIHDLTANQDFREKTIINWRRMSNDDIEYDELVLTGDVTERSSKRYRINQKYDNPICSCCGNELEIKPWAFDSFTNITDRGICKACVMFFDSINTEEMIEWRDMKDLNTEYKPWDFKEEFNKLTDNVLLWD